MLPIGDDNTAASAAGAASVGGVARVVRVAHIGGFVAGVVLTFLFLGSEGEGEMS